MSGLLTAQQVAEEWNCHPDHVRRLCRTNRLTAMRLGSDWRISREAVDAYTRRHTTVVPSTETATPATARTSPVARPAVVLCGEYDAVVTGPVPWRSEVITAASPAAGRARSAGKKKAGSVRR